MEHEDVLDMKAVGEAFGWSVSTVSKYRNANGRYAKHPFPAPDGYISGSPYWFSGRMDEIEAWSISRPGRGAGGGKPR
jgi:hypothetical protein